MNDLLREHFPVEQQEAYFDHENDVISVQLTSINAVVYSSDCDKEDVYDIPFEKIANGRWCDSPYPGKAMDIHYRNRYIAYATDQLEYGVAQSKITVKQLDSQRSVTIAQDGMRGKIQDIAFSYTVDPAFLACVFNSGFIWIFRLAESSRENGLPDFDVKLVFSIKSEMNMGQINFQRVCWCPLPRMYPGSRDSSYSERRFAEKCGRMLALFCGNRIDTYDLDSIRHQFGSFKGAITHDKITDGLTTITLVNRMDDNYDLITDMKFSSNGDQIAYVANDGHVRIHTVPLSANHRAKQIGCFELYPLGTIVSLTFMDASEDLPSAWNIALTFAHNTNEAKIWKCREWNCLQLIRLDPDCAPSSSFFGKFKIFAEPENGSVLLSDNRNNAAYLLHAQHFDDHDVTLVNRVTEFVLPCRVITMSILETKCVKFDRATPYDSRHIVHQDESSSLESTFSGIFLDTFIVEKLAIGRVPLMIALTSDRSLCTTDTESDFTSSRCAFPREPIKRNLYPVFTLNQVQDESIVEKETNGDDSDSDVGAYDDRIKALRDRTTELDERYLGTWCQVTRLRSDSIDLYLKARKIDESVAILVKSAATPTLNSYLSDGDAGNVLYRYVGTFPINPSPNYVETFSRALDSKNKDAIRTACAKVDFFRLFETQNAACEDVLLKAVAKLRADLPNTFRGGSRAFLENAFLYFKINNAPNSSPIFLKMYAKLGKFAKTVTDKRIKKYCRELIQLLPATAKPLTNTEAPSMENINSTIAVSLKNDRLDEALILFRRKKKDILASCALAPKVVLQLATKLADAFSANASVVSSYLPAIIRYWKEDDACQLKYPSLLDDLIRKLNSFYSSDDPVLANDAEPLLAILDIWPKIKVDRTEVQSEGESEDENEDENEDKSEDENGGEPQCEDENSERSSAASSNNASTDSSDDASSSEISGTSNDDQSSI